MEAYLSISDMCLSNTNGFSESTLLCGQRTTVNKDVHYDSSLHVSAYSAVFGDIVTVNVRR